MLVCHNFHKIFDSQRTVPVGPNSVLLLLLSMLLWNIVMFFMSKC